MNNLCVEAGYYSINHAGEELCGDHVETVMNDTSAVLVLADGLGSGVKACILSTLTAKIISTMINSGLSVQNCLETIMATLPVCSVRQMAYSTFTIIHIEKNEWAEIYQFENPKLLWFRNGEEFDYPCDEMNVVGKKILKTRARIEENDYLLTMSDGCPHAGIGNKMNFGWQRSDIAAYIKPYTTIACTAKNISTTLIDEINELYGGEPGDDATVAAVRVRKRNPMNILFGPPSDRNDCDKMMRLFFSKEGKHIVCGGTTANIVASHLQKPVVPLLSFVKNDIPPIARIEGVDLVTEGVITMNRVVEYAKNHLDVNDSYIAWGYDEDGASIISRMLFEEATDINFYVGRAINPAHQNPDLPINFSIKMQLVAELSDCLTQMGKRIKVSYF